MKKIPKEDLKAINKTFESKSGGQIIRKDIKGNIVGRGKLVNSRGFIISDFIGRVLKHDKFWIPVGEKQITVAKKGQKFDEVDEEIRSQIFWQESDFE